MRRALLTLTFGLVIVAVAALATGSAMAASPAVTLPSTPAAAIAANRSLALDKTYTCRHAWRCGPSDCGWRTICAAAGWRPTWQKRHYYWRRHQWRWHDW
ncbi:MAG TPA: hypothetical protein VFC54_00140 [Pseudolabrys sp.]|nr:hypothetical protein [Pseudolabrys sp.]